MLNARASLLRTLRCQSPTTRTDLVGDLEQPGGIFRGFGRVSRHIYATGFHHRGVDQPVDAFDVPAAGIGGFEFVGQRRMFAAFDTATTDNAHRGGGHQRKDRIEPGSDRKLRQIHQ